jgi:hypothetical protein
LVFGNIYAGSRREWTHMRVGGLDVEMNLTLIRVDEYLRSTHGRIQSISLFLCPLDRAAWHFLVRYHSSVLLWLYLLGCLGIEETYLSCFSCYHFVLGYFQILRYSLQPLSVLIPERRITRSTAVAVFLTSRDIICAPRTQVLKTVRQMTLLMIYIFCSYSCSTQLSEMKYVYREQLWWIFRIYRVTTSTPTSTANSNPILMPRPSSLRNNHL